MAQKTVAYTTPITGATVTSATLTFDNQGLITAASSGTGAARYTTTATAAGTTTLANTDTEVQFFTGTTTQTVKLPVVTTLANGWMFKIVNRSTGKVTVQSSGGNTITILSPASVPTSNWGVFTCIDIAGGTGVASWDFEQGRVEYAAMVSNSAASAINSGSLFSFDITNYDPSTMFSGGTTITVPVAGRYLVSVTITVSGVAGSSFSGTVNGTRTFSGLAFGYAGFVSMMMATAVLNLAAGDAIAVLNDSPGARTMYTDPVLSFFHVAKLA